MHCALAWRLSENDEVVTVENEGRGPGVGCPNCGTRSGP
jgi:hypothetical protein